MSNPRLVVRFEDELREYLTPHRDKLSDALQRFDRVILHSNMPHSVVKSVRRVAGEFTDRRVSGYGYHPLFRFVRYGGLKEFAASLFAIEQGCLRDPRDGR